MTHVHGFSPWRTDLNGNAYRHCCDCGYVESPDIPQPGDDIRITEGYAKGSILRVDGAHVHNQCVVPTSYSARDSRSHQVVVGYELFLTREDA